MSVDDVSRAKKRPRTERTSDSEANHPGNKVDGIIKHSIPKNFQKDELYYYSDGSCSILVEATLFKLHHFQLRREPSAFLDMLDIPQGAIDSVEQMTDENPLVLHDSLEEFRALCWAIYATAREVQNQNDLELVEFDKLIELLSISNKYGLVSYESWAEEILTKHTESDDEDDGHPLLGSDVPIERLQRLLAVSIRTECHQLQNAVQDAWLMRLEGGRDSASFALQQAAIYDLRSFQGSVYYSLLEDDEAERVDGTTALLFPKYDLTSEQECCLLRGFRSLTQYWRTECAFNANRSSLPPKPPCNLCIHQPSQCKGRWSNAWLKYNKDHLSTNFLDYAVARPIRGFDLVESMVNNSASTCLKERIAEMKSQFEKSLADHFLGPVT